MELADVITWSNLLRAARRAAAGKRSDPEVAVFELRLEEHLLQLRDEIGSLSYEPGPYRSFLVHDPKRRVISAAPFRDRVVHHALCQVIEPAFERRFIADSYANRVGRGTHRALDRCQEFARRYLYVLRCDVVQFFPSIDHEILRERIHRVVGDPGLRWLVDATLRSGANVLRSEYRLVNFPGDDLFAVLRPRGLPIGNLTSQFWANVYLDPLDQFVKRELRCRGYVRYVDDLVLFSSSKRELWGWKVEIDRRLASLRLMLHPGAGPAPVGEGIPFLGFVVGPERRRLKRRAVIRFRRRLTLYARSYARGEMGIAEIGERIRSWVAHARNGSTTGLRTQVLGKVRFGPRGASMCHGAIHGCPSQSSSR